MFEVRIFLSGEWQTLRIDPAKTPEQESAETLARTLAGDLWNNGWDARVFRDGVEIDRN